MTVTINDELAKYIQELLHKDVELKRLTASGALHSNRGGRVAMSAMLRIRIANRAALLWDAALKEALDSSPDT